MNIIRVKSKYNNMLVSVDGKTIQFKGGEALVTISQAAILSKKSEYTILNDDEYTLAIHKNIIPHYDNSNVTFSISVVCYNNLKATKRCVSNIFLFSKKFNYELLITDNGSDKETIDYLKTLQSERIFVHFNSYNHGFMDPHIEALKIAKGKFFVVLNNDFYVQDDFWLEKIFTKFMTDQEVKIVGPITGSLNPDGYGQICNDLTYDYVEGSCLTIYTDFAKKIGLFDNQLLSFAYCEDSDLSLRVRSLGYKIKRVGFSYIHDQGTTTKNPSVYPYVKLIAKKNHFKFKTKWKKYLATKQFNVSTHKAPQYKMDKLYPFNKHNFLKAKKLLLAREVGIGDVLFFSTCCAWLKSQNPKIEITFATNYTNRRVLQSNPYINNVISYDDIKYRSVLVDYDYGIHFVPFFDALKYKKSELQKHRIDLIRNYFGVEKSVWNYALHYTVTDLEKMWTKSLLANRNLGKGVISIILATTDNKRDYPYNKELIHKFITAGYFVIVMDKHKTFLDNNPMLLNISGQTTLGQTSALLDKTNLVITPDTGILHIAGALGKNIITFFNSFPSKTRIKYYENCFAFDLWESCTEARIKQPCLYSKDKRCSSKNCFKTIMPNIIFQKALDLGYIK